MPEPVGRRASRDPADDLPAELPDPVDVDIDLTDDRAATITARLDRLQELPAIDDSHGIDLW